MPTPTTLAFRELFSVSSQVAEPRVQMCLENALDEARVKLGIEAFDEVFNGDASTLEDSEYLDENITATDETALRLSRVTRAVYYYTAAELVLNTALNLRATGMVKKEQDAGSPALGSSSQVVNEYLSPQEIQQYVTALRSKADGLIAAYIIEPEPVNPYGASRLVRG